MRSTRVVVLLLSMLTSLTTVALAASESADSMTWHEPSRWGIEGKGWTDVQRYYDRLPSKAEGVVRESVWGLSRQSAGMSVRFRTDAREIQVRYVLLHADLAKPHMAATGVSGADLYARTENGDWRWDGPACTPERPDRSRSRSRTRSANIHDVSPAV